MSALGRSSFTPMPLARGDASRARRVILLLCLLVTLNLGDLYATVLHASSVGMIELNPIGAYLIDSGSIEGLVMFKLGCLGVAVGLLLKLRHQAAGELATWLLVLVMSMLTFYWYVYSAEMADQLTDVNYRDLPQVMRSMSRR